MKKESITKLIVSTFLLLAIFTLPVNSWADQILTFEGLNDYETLTTQYAGINFQGATVLTISGGSLNPQFPPHSGDASIYNPSGPMELLFFTPIDYFSGYVTYNSGMTISAFDALNNLLGTASGIYASNYVGSGNQPNELLTINAQSISRVVLTGGDGNNFTLDDVQFTGSVNAVPEPATMMLFGLGLLGLAGVTRKKN